jgi:hypothetical protein
VLKGRPLSGPCLSRGKATLKYQIPLEQLIRLTSRYDPRGVLVGSGAFEHAAPWIETFNPHIRPAPVGNTRAQHRLPPVYFLKHFAKDGGLISYGPDAFAQYRRVLVLCGSHPQVRKSWRPTGRGRGKVRTCHNLKTAKALELAIPSNVLARADEVIK